MKPRKVIFGIFLAPMVVSVLIVIIFIFMLVDGNSSSGNGDITVSGLPQCIKEEMVIASLQCQEKYKHPASVTLAQIIQESTGKIRGFRVWHIHTITCLASRQGKTGLERHVHFLPVNRDRMVRRIR